MNVLCFMNIFLVSSSSRNIENYRKDSLNLEMVKLWNFFHEMLKIHREIVYKIIEKITDKRMKRKFFLSLFARKFVNYFLKKFPWFI